MFEHTEGKTCAVVRAHGRRGSVHRQGLGLRGEAMKGSGLLLLLAVLFVMLGHVV